jgi:hypothetical protein
VPCGCSIGDDPCTIAVTGRAVTQSSAGVHSGCMYMRPALCCSPGTLAVAPSISACSGWSTLVAQHRTVPRHPARGVPCLAIYFLSGSAMAAASVGMLLDALFVPMLAPLYALQLCRLTDVYCQRRCPLAVGPFWRAASCPGRGRVAAPRT